MKRSLILCAGLLGVCACATGLPPTPSVAPLTTAIDDSLTSAIAIPAAPDEITAADALVLNDLAATAPDERLVPAFDAQRVRWDIDVHTYSAHPRVKYYLDYFQRVARKSMAVFLERGARYEPMIRSRFEAENLPGDLGYLALIESGYSNEAVSHAYAVGMWQFMRKTGQGYGLRVDSWVDERRDPVKATAAAASHLRDLRERFGSLYLAAAAYNAGAGKVSRSLGKLQWDAPDAVDAPAPAVDMVADSLGTEEDTVALEQDPADEEIETAPDSTDMTSDAAFFRLASTDLLAAETQDYVPKLIAAAIIAKDAEHYGFGPVTAQSFAYDSLVVSDATGLDVVARLAKTSLDEIRALNPQYLRLATPPRSSAVIRLPSGTGETVATRYAALPRSARIRYLSYVPRRRERWSTIAARYHLPTADLRSANPRSRGSSAAPGSRLVIPTVAVPSALAMRAAVGSKARYVRHGVVHRVRRGETLSGIARRYRVSVRALKRANAIRQDYALRAGMRLRIPG
ncbi:MAG TPA: transglycosylase SLT domain-containing protein [Gemmatimonadales bacterium]|jgi:membrane-bound lytic murein transglycosylase D